MASLLKLLIDLISPPRTRERIVRTLLKEDLERVVREDGSLPYSDPRVQALVWEMKYYRNTKALELADYFLAQRLIPLIAEDLIERPLLIPMPVFREKGKAFKGHVEILCESLIRRHDIDAEYAPHSLVKIKKTPRQVELPAAARHTNLVGSFRADLSVAGRVCIVIDDVRTTGATLVEAKRALAVAGARFVEGITLAT